MNHIQLTMNLGARASALALLAASAAAFDVLPMHQNLRPVRRLTPGDVNVLLIVLDDLGTDKLRMYTEDALTTYGTPNCEIAQIDNIPTPQLEALRARGALYTHCYSDPSCSPTRATIMTGRHSRRTGVGTAYRAQDIPLELPLSEVCLPELMDAFAPTYKRGAFGKWHLTPDENDHSHPVDRGFEVYKGTLMNPEDGHYTWRKSEAQASPPQSGYVDIAPIGNNPPDESVWDAHVTRQDANAWINSLAANERFFAYVAFSPPHAPIEVPPFTKLSARSQGRLTLLGLQPGDDVGGDPELRRVVEHHMIEAIDTEIGLLLGGIPASVMARTLVIVIGDNGTDSPSFPESPLLDSRGKRTPYDLGTRVPLIVAAPPMGDVMPEALQLSACTDAATERRCCELVSSVDVFRTIAQAVGIDDATIDGAVGACALDSLSFLYLTQRPELKGPRTYAYNEIFANATWPTCGGLVPSSQIHRTVTDGTYRLIAFKNGQQALFHTYADPCEEDPLTLPILPSDPYYAIYNGLLNEMNSL